MRQWRLIYDYPTTGIRNMAVDEAIMWAVARGDSPPTLRLYGWQPPCLSLGYGQPTSDVDFARVQQRGWDVVRRPTGGRAILHIDELTYSVSLPADHPLVSDSIVESYRRLSQALLAAVEALGAHPHANRRADDVKLTGPVCFEVPSHYEITADGRKLIGSAQLRRRGGVLQHGSLPLVGDVGRICAGLSYPDEATRQQAQQQVRERATTLQTALDGAIVDWQTAAEAVIAGFVEVFGIDFGTDFGSLTEAEEQKAAQLAAEIYSSVERKRRNWRE